MIDLLVQSAAMSGDFTVNIAAPSGMVPITWAGIGGAGILYNGAMLSGFQQKDNFVILSTGYKLPLSFEIEKHVDLNIPIVPMFFWLRSLPSDSTFSLTPPAIHMPFDNYELNYGEYVDLTSFAFPAADTHFQILSSFNAAFFGDVGVSMFNVPAALDGNTYKCTIFAKILHNLPIEDVPAPS